MALIKDFETPAGIGLNYHRILKIEFDCVAQQAQVTMAIYASAAKREQGCPQAWNERLLIPFSAFEHDPRAALYPAVLDFWSSYLKGATSDQAAVPGAATVQLTDAATEPPQPEPEPDPV
jgi:hypothetical protein